jgi:hypothetical protein
LTHFEQHQETLKSSLRTHLEEYLEKPTGKGYHFLRNKIAEYYDLSTAYADEKYKAEQDKLRDELGIRQS